MAVRISVMVLRVCALIALILGILFWTKAVQSEQVVNIHMLLGILVTFAIWALGYFILTAPKGANLGLAIGAFVIGICVLGLGMGQRQLFVQMPRGSDWIIRTLHLLIGLAAIGLGEAIAGRYKRLNATNA